MHPLYVLINISYKRMPKDYEKLFSNLRAPEPPDGLLEQIMLRLRKERRSFIIRRRIVIFSLGLIGSMAAFMPVWRLVQTELAASGFMRYFSLLFSDTSTVAAYWQSFVYALLESLPAFSLAVFLFVVFVFLESLKVLVQNMKIILTPMKLNK
jgi:hypothetical protein